MYIFFAKTHSKLAEADELVKHVKPDEHVNVT